jgi:hypothetical protein
MSEAEPRPEAVEAALAWLRGHEATFTRDALASGLRDAGYSEAEIAAAFGRLDREALEPAPRDLRSRAAAILVVAFLGTWLVLVLRMIAVAGTGGFVPVAAVILGTILLVIGAISFVGIESSSRLRTGTTGVLVAILAIPFVLLVIVAGLCVATTGPLGL